jgi:predicted GTPase
MRALATTVARSDADMVVAATPVDLAAVLDLKKPVVRARYGLADAGEPRLTWLVDAFLARVGPPG